MSNELALPEISARGLVPHHDLSLARQLRSSWNVRLRTSWTQISGRQSLISIEFEAPPTKAEAAGAIAAIAEANKRRAQPSQIAKALAVLTAVCAKPADFDDAKVVLWSERLKQVLSEYPAEVALASVSTWPQNENGKWWPTENELRLYANAHMHFRHKLNHMLWEAENYTPPLPPPEPAPPPKPYDDGFKDKPYGATEAYAEALLKVKPNTAARYLLKARFTDALIGIEWPLAGMTLEDAAPGLLAEHGVRVVAPHGYTAQGNIVWGE